MSEPRIEVRIIEMTAEGLDAVIAKVREHASTLDPASEQASIARETLTLAEYAREQMKITTRGGAA